MAPVSSLRARRGRLASTVTAITPSPSRTCSATAESPFAGYTRLTGCEPLNRLTAPLAQRGWIAKTLPVAVFTT